MDFQFDYVTGVIFLWTIGVTWALSIGLFTLCYLLQKNDSKRVNYRLDKHVKRIGGLEKIWLDFKTHRK